MYLLSGTASGGGGLVFTIAYIAVLCVIVWFLLIRPQKKEQKRIDAMLAEVAVGDSIVTTSGFYGTIIDMSEDTVIIEFGNNKNCRIPMQRAAISAVEKPEDAAKAVEEKKDKKDTKK